MHRGVGRGHKAFASSWTQCPQAPSLRLPGKAWVVWEGLVLLQSFPAIPSGSPAVAVLGIPRAEQRPELSSDTRWLRGSARFSRQQQPRASLSTPPVGSTVPALPAQWAAPVDRHSLRSRARPSPHRDQLPGTVRTRPGQLSRGKAADWGCLEQRAWMRESPACALCPLHPRPPGHEALLSP